MRLLPKSWFLEKEQPSTMEASDEGNRYDRRLSAMEWIGLAVLVVIEYFLQFHFYPWLGIPLVGLSGYAPFMLSIFIAAYFLWYFPFFKQHEMLLMAVAIVLGTTMCIFFLMFYFRVWG